MRTIGSAPSKVFEINDEWCYQHKHPLLINLLLINLALRWGGHALVFSEGLLTQLNLHYFLNAHDRFVGIIASLDIVVTEVPITHVTVP